MDESSEIVTLSSVREAALRIAPHVFRTPIVGLIPSGIFLKAESLQPVGAFKIRGAFNALLTLDEGERSRGIIAHSSGNHAQAVAYAAQKLGIACTVVMPDNVSPVKAEAARYWGAQVHLTKPALRMSECERLARELDLVVIEPFNSLAIMAGTGTIGLEILEQRPGVRLVTVPVSGGGLIGGVAAAIAQAAPQVKVIGVEPAFANDAELSFRANELVRLSMEETARTIADGLRVLQLGPLPWANIRRFAHDIVSVSEDEIKSAMRRIAREARLISEPSGAVALAGAVKLGLEPESTVAVLSGGNVDPAFYASVLADRDKA